MATGLGYDDADQVETRWLAVLFTDVVESTSLWERSPEEMGPWIWAHHDTIVAKVVEHGGRVVRLMGDGVYAVFEHAVAAVDAAIAAQRALLELARSGQLPLSVRMGLNGGICRVHRGDVYGQAVNRAARLHDLAHGGQIVVADELVRAVEPSLGNAGFEFRALGRYGLRGVEELVEVHEVVAPGLAAGFPPLRSESRGYDELPVETTSLIARDELVAMATDRVRTNRLVTLWGDGGVGKTRVALRVASQVRHPFRDGVRYVDLAPVAGEADVGRAVAERLHVAPATGEDLGTAVARALRPRRLLLVLDNGEHVMWSVRRLVALVLDTCSEVSILAVSREPLGRPDEQRLVVPPLPVPPAAAISTGARLRVDQAITYPSVALFVERARAVDPSFTLSDANAFQVCELCRALDGVPLAIELAAARLDVETIGELLAERAQLAVRLDALGADTRERSSVAGWVLASMDTLSPRDREALGSLATFVGPFTRAMGLELLANADGAAEAIDRLVRKSLLGRVEPSGRLRLMEVTRQVVLADRGGELADRCRRRHAELMARRAAAGDTELRTARESAAIAELRADLADHRAAVRFLRDEGNLDLAADLVVHLYQFCHFQLVSELYEWAIALARLLPDDHPRVAQVCGAAAIGEWFAGHTEAAIALGERAIACSRDDDPPEQTLWARNALFNAYGYAGDLERTRDHFTAFTRLCRATNDPFWRIAGLGFETVSMLMFGMADKARGRAEEAITLARELGNPDCMHWALYALGRVLAVEEPELAEVAFSQAADAARSVDSRWHLSLDLVELVGLQRRAGDVDRAAASALELLDLVIGSGNRSQIAQLLAEVAALLVDRGDLEGAALAHLGRANLPEMPKNPIEQPTAAEVERVLEAKLGDRWQELTIRARGTAEHELLRQSRGWLESALQPS